MSLSLRALSYIDSHTRFDSFKQIATMILLSPAKNYETAVAAIQAGADAVYIGAPKFGARAAAGNTVEDIARLVNYAHAFGVEVHVTLNTLLHDDEYEEAFRLAVQLHQIGIDALIVQDLTLAQALLTSLPDLTLHASTQCDNRTVEQVARLRDMGFKQVVLARELSIEKIKTIHQAVPDILLEAFVHGALCVSYSGRCFMSEVLMNRSANRGCCAQMCRMKYDLLDKDGNEVRDNNGLPIHQRYLLSLQDLDRSLFLKELIEAGVTTFKIEGRLKDAAYVTNITAYYRRALDNINKQHAAINYSFSPSPAKTFHRGSTDYFLHGRTKPMANWLTPKSTGEYIGQLLAVNGNTLKVRLKDGVELHNGDGLTIGDDGCSVNGFRADTIKINKSFPAMTNVPQALFRNLDVDFMKSLHAERRVPVDVRFTVTDNAYTLIYQPLSAHLKPHQTYCELPESAQSALNPQAALRTVEQQLTKLGDTIYVAQSFTLDNQRTDRSVPFIPIAQLNALRRKALQNTEDSNTAQLQPQRPSHLQPQIPSHTFHINNQQLQGNGERTQFTSEPLMTCKYCILYELGRCLKRHQTASDSNSAGNSAAAPQTLPAAIRLQNGTLLSLHFNCSNCEMTITFPL